MLETVREGISTMQTGEGDGRKGEGRVVFSVLFSFIKIADGGTDKFGL